jgi:hypothetical protein
MAILTISDYYDKNYHEDHDEKRFSRQKVPIDFENWIAKRPLELQ